MTKIIYKLDGGKAVEVEVPDDVAQLTVDFEREDRSESRKSRWRKERSIEAMAEFGSDIADSSPDAEQLAEQNDEREKLQAAVKKLSHKQRYIVQMHYYEELSLNEIAKRLNVSRPAISQQLQTIHKKLKKLL